jgi:pyridoxamine 5'-phosphate oxidase-like protein
MFETEADIAWLQELIDRSHVGASRQMRDILTPERRLNARQVVAYLQGTKHLALATVTARGEPRVSPVDGVFLWGRFTFGSTADSARMTHLRRRPAVSATHFIGDVIAITVHGRATLLPRGNPDGEAIAAEWTKIYHLSPWEMGANVILARIEPDRLYTFAQDPSKYPE